MDTVAGTGISVTGQDSGDMSKSGPKGADSQAETEDAIDVNGHRETGQGVVKILQPNAIPDSGLLSKD